MKSAKQFKLIMQFESCNIKSNIQPFLIKKKQLRLKKDTENLCII